MSYSFMPFSADSFAGAGGSSNLLLIYDSNVLIDAARAFGGVASTLPYTVSDDPILFYGPKKAFEFVSNAEYTLTLTTSVRKNIPFVGKMEVYLIGSAFPTTNPYGELIASYEDEENSLFTPFERLEWNFIAQKTGIGYLRFLIYGGQWSISDVSIKPASEFGFTPDEIDFLIPIDGIKNEYLNFRTEFYDANNNLFPITASSTAFFDGGNTVLRGDQNRIDGELIVAPSGSVGLTLTTRGFTDIDGNFNSGSTAIFIGNGTAGNANTPFLAGSGSGGPIFTLGNRFIARQSGSQFTVTVSGTLLVEHGGGWADVRSIISGSGVTALYVIEAATFALNSASLMDVYSGSIYTASLQAASASLAQYAVATSASLAARDIAFSASQAQYTETRAVVDTVNKIKLPTSVKSVSGLYLETGSIGFYSTAQSQYPVVINDGGEFRFADTSSYIGGTDPYQRVVGFAGGAFMVRTDKLFLSTPGFQVIGSNVSASAANAIKMGANAANINFVSGAGFYADGTGSFRVGTDTTGSEYFSFSPGVGLVTKAKRLVLDAGGAYMTADANSVASAASFKLGSNASGITSTSGSGFYADGAGNFRVGKGVGAGDYMLFSADNALFISSSNLFLQVGTAPVLQLNAYQFVLGSKIPSAWPFPQNDTGFSGSYMNKDGQVFFGKANGNFIQFGGQVIEMRSSAFILDTPGLLLYSGSSGQPSGAFAVGASPSSMTLTNGTGVFLGGNGTFRAGNPSGNQIVFDGSTFSVTGSINVQGGNAATQAYAISTAGNAQTSASTALSSHSSSNASYNVQASGTFAGADRVRPDGSLRTATAPAGTGLHIGSDYMGYYHSTNGWTSYMSASGLFQFRGDANNRVTWDGGTLSVVGSITVMGGNAATQAYAISTAGNAQTSGSNSLSSFSSSNASQNNNLSASLASGDFLRPNGAPRSNSSPAGTGLFIGADYMGYYAGGAWTTYMQNNGNFALSGNGSNYISWNGSTLSVRANEFFLSSSGLFLDSTTGTKVIRVGLTSGYSAGTGVYMDSAGQFRAGSTSEYVGWNGSTLTVRSRATTIETPAYFIDDLSIADLPGDLTIHNGTLTWGTGNVIPARTATSVTASIDGLCITPSRNTAVNPSTEITNVYKKSAVQTIVPGVVVSTSAPSSATSYFTGDLWVQI